MSLRSRLTPGLTAVYRTATGSRPRITRRLAGSIVLVGVHVAHAADGTSIAGDYVCKSDCHPSDAPPSIEVDGTVATCRNDLGGLFSGKVLNSNAVYCFKMIGTLSRDGKAIMWSNGGVWERRHRP